MTQEHGNQGVSNVTQDVYLATPYRVETETPSVYRAHCNWLYKLLWFNAATYKHVNFDIQCRLYYSMWQTKLN